MSRIRCSLSSTFQLAFVFLGLAVPLAFYFDLLFDSAFPTLSFPLSCIGSLLRLSQRILRRRLNINPTQVHEPHRYLSRVLTESSPSASTSPKPRAHISTLPFQRSSNSDSVISISSSSSSSHVTLLLPSVASTMSSHTNSRQLPRLSATLLIIITCGTFVAFSLLAITCYCCAGCRKRRNSIKEKRRGNGRTSSVADDLEKGGRMKRGIMRTPDYGAGTDSPSAFEFSPPSPTWRPTMPSLVYISSNINAGLNTYGNGGNALASGRGEILSGETIMQEREPNRRKVYGGGGRATQPRQGQMPSSSASVASAYSSSAVESGRTAQPGGSNSYRLHRPYAQAQHFQGRVGAGVGTGLGTSMNRGVGIPNAPPLPAHAPKIYRPPAYHRPSRIMPMPAQPSSQPAIRPPATSRTNVAPAASTSTTRSEQRVKRERKDSKKKGGAVHVPSNSNPKSGLQNSKFTGVHITVPQIKVHFAHDGSSETETGTEPYLGNPNANTRTLAETRVQAQVQRSNSLASQNQSQSGGRPFPGSGLGISTINLVGSTPGSGSGGGGSITRTSTTERSRRSMTITQATATSCPGPSSPATPSEEDVRLAYRVSTVSVVPEPEPSKSRRDSLKKAVGARAGAGAGAVTAAKVGDSSSRTTAEISINKRKTSSTDKRKSRFYNGETTKTAVSELQLQPPSASSEVHQGARRRSRNVRPSSSEMTRRRSIPNADANTNSSKRQALGVGAVDQVIKSELHDMRSLGSESFDSLIAYLDESVDPDEGEGNTRNKIRDARNSVRKGKRTSTVEAVQTKSKKPSVAVEMVEVDNARVTREETVRVDERAYEAWVGSLDASPSVLKLAHVELDSCTTSVKARRRSRSASAGDGRSMNRNGSGEKTRTDVGKVEREAGIGARVDSTSASRVPLRERNTNIDPEPRSRRRHTRNKSEGSCLLESTNSLNKNASKDTDTVQAQGKAGMHVRALRARSASLKMKSQPRIGIAEDNDAGTGTRDPVYAATAVGSSRPQSQNLSLTRPRKVDSSKTDSAKDKTAATYDRSRDAPARLPSFSIPSTATQLYEAFPASPSDACSSSSSSESLAFAGSRLGLKSDALEQGPAPARIWTHSASGSVPAVTSKTTRRTRPTSTHGTTVITTATISSSKVAAVPVPAASSSRRNSKMSNSKRNSEAKAKVAEKTTSSAAYIARCAPTPHLKSAVLLSSFLSPGPPSNPDPLSPMPSRHLPGYELELERESGHQNPNSTSRSRQSRSRYSVHSVRSVSSIESAESGESATSVWGRRSEWGRESLTPRFDHLRAVLEGERGGIGPPPIPSLASGAMRQGGRRDLELGI